MIGRGRLLLRAQSSSQGFSGSQFNRGVRRNSDSHSRLASSLSAYRNLDAVEYADEQYALSWPWRLRLCSKTPPTKRRTVRGGSPAMLYSCQRECGAAVPSLNEAWKQFTRGKIIIEARHRDKPARYRTPTNQKYRAGTACRGRLTMNNKRFSNG